MQRSRFRSGQRGSRADTLSTLLPPLLLLSLPRLPLLEDMERFKVEEEETGRCVEGSIPLLSSFRLI